MKERTAGEADGGILRHLRTIQARGQPGHDNAGPGRECARRASTRGTSLVMLLRRLRSLEQSGAELNFGELQAVLQVLSPLPRVRARASLSPNPILLREADSHPSSTAAAAAAAATSTPMASQPSLPLGLRSLCARSLRRGRSWVTSIASSRSPSCASGPRLR